MLNKHFFFILYSYTGGKKIENEDKKKKDISSFFLRLQIRSKNQERERAKKKMFSFFHVQSGNEKDGKVNAIKGTYPLFSHSLKKF